MNWVSHEFIRNILAHKNAKFVCQRKPFYEVKQSMYVVSGQVMRIFIAHLKVLIWNRFKF